MANLDRRRVYDGTVATRGVVDVRRSSMREVFHYTDVGTGTVEEVIDQAYEDAPIARSVAGATVVLSDISARMKSCDTGVAVARYSANVFKTSPGFANVEWELTSEQIQWIQTSALKPNEAGPFDESDPDDFYFQVQNIESARQGNKTGQFDPATGVPSGVAHRIDDKVVPYSLKVPVWNIRVRTVLTSHPGPTIKDYAYRPVNDGAVTWSGFLFPEKTLRFNGAKVKQIGDDYHVTYSFTHRAGKWVEQRLVGVKTPEVDSSGNPKKDSEDNIIFHSRAAYLTLPMYLAGPYATPGFPEGDNG